MSRRPPTLYLASASPRRRELLAVLGLPFTTLRLALDETRLPGEPPGDYVLRLAADKARAGLARCPPGENACVLGADTAVVLGKTVLGKPRDRADGLAMLARLSGVTHQVFTGVAVATAGGVQTRLSLSDVTFRELSERDRVRYWDSGEPAGKAGAYGIQGLGAAFVSRMSGSYSGVVGLPLFETAALLAECGLDVWAGECG